MADNKKIIIDVETKVDDKDLDKVSSSVKKIGDGANKAKKGLDGMSDGAKKLTASFKDVAKAMGFIKLLEMLKDVFMQNQKVADLFATAMGAINIIFNQVVEVITGVIEKVGALTNGFEGTTKVIKGVFGIALDSLKLQFYSIKLVIEELQLAWENSFFGNKDPARIKELNDKISETSGIIKDLGEDIIKNGKQVVDNAGKMVDEFGQVVEGVVDGVSKIDPSKALAQSKSLVAALKAAKMATAQLSGVVADYERKEEKLRQTRDDVTKSIQERKQASLELAEVIKKDSKAQLELVKLNVRVAQLNYDINKSDENSVALIEAKNKVKEVEAQVEGKVTEQKMADVAVTREGIDLDKSVIKSTTDRVNKQKEFNQSLMDDNISKLEQQKSNLEELKTTELVYLKDNIDRFKEGTQAKADAEQEYLNRKQEIDNQIVSTDKSIVDKRKEISRKQIDDTAQLLTDQLAYLDKYGMFSLKKKVELYNKERDLQLAKLKKDEEQEIKAANGVEEAISIIKEKYREKEKSLRKNAQQEKLQEQLKEIDAAIQMAQSVNSAFSSLNDLFNQQSEQKLNQIQKETDAVAKQTQQHSEELDRQVAAQRAAIESMNISDDERTAKLAALDQGTVASKNEMYQQLYDIQLKNFEAGEKIKKKEFQRNKALQISTAILNTAAGVVQALGSMPPPFSFISASAVGLAGALQVAKIASTSYEGGTPPDKVSFYNAPTSNKSNFPSSPSAGSTGSLGQSSLKLSDGALKYQKVYVTETDITRVQNKVNVIENRSVIR
jgi:hypothetical protein